MSVVREPEGRLRRMGAASWDTLVLLRRPCSRWEAINGAHLTDHDLDHPDHRSPLHDLDLSGQIRAWIAPLDVWGVL